MDDFLDRDCDMDVVDTVQSRVLWYSTVPPGKQVYSGPRLQRYDGEVPHSLE